MCDDACVPSVLIVDDDRALRKLMRAYLEQESISVIEAESGEEALALIDKIAPTLMLLDLRLPGIAESRSTGRTGRFSIPREDVLLVVRDLRRDRDVDARPALHEIGDGRNGLGTRGQRPCAELGDLRKAGGRIHLRERTASGRRSG